MFKRVTDLLKPRAPAAAPGHAPTPASMQDDDAATPIGPEPPEIMAMAFEGPMWGYGLRAPAWLLPAKPEDTRRVLFLSFAKTMGEDDQAQKQRTDTSILPRCVQTFDRQANDPSVLTSKTGSSKNPGKIVCGVRTSRSDALPRNCHVRAKIFSFDSSKNRSSV